jgi:hypothetical protein
LLAQLRPNYDGQRKERPENQYIALEFFMNLIGMLNCCRSVGLTQEMGECGECRLLRE